LHITGADAEPGVSLALSVLEVSAIAMPLNLSSFFSGLATPKATEKLGGDPESLGRVHK
jgi:hypothetical protein